MILHHTMFLMKGVSSVLFFVLGGRQHQDARYGGRLATQPSSSSTATKTMIYNSAGTTMAEKEASRTTIEICLSPGCVADGANEALLKLQALSATSASTSTAPPMQVVPGVCCSLCGNGPVAKETTTSNSGSGSNIGKSKSYRKLNTNQKLLDLLSLGEESNLNPNQRVVLEGIDLCLEGEKELSKKNYPQALEKYAGGIERGMDAAIELLVGDGNDNNNSSDSASLQWLLQALCNEASAKLQTKDIDGAIGSAEKALKLSQSSYAAALEILQSAYQTKGNDDRKELEVLEALFVLYEAEAEQQTTATNTGSRAKRKRISPMEANRRRTLGFRLSRLQATVQRD